MVKLAAPVLEVQADIFAAGGAGGQSGSDGHLALCHDAGELTGTPGWGTQAVGTSETAGLWVANAYTGGTMTPRIPDLVGGPYASGLTNFDAADLFMNPRGECPAISLRTWTPDGYTFPGFDVLLVSGARTTEVKDVRLSYGPMDGFQPPLAGLATGLDRQPVTELQSGQVYAMLVPSAWDGFLDIEYTIGATVFKLDRFHPPLASTCDLALQYWDIDVGGPYVPYVHSQGSLKAGSLVVRRLGQFQITNGAYVFAWDTGFLDGSMVEVTGAGSELECYDSTYLDGSLKVTDGAAVSVGQGRQLVVGADGGGLIGDGGGGTIRADVFMHGWLRSSLRVEGDYKQAASGELMIFVRDGAPGADSCDLLDVTGEVRLSGTLTLNFLDLPNPRPGDVYTFLTASEFSGAFDSLQVLHADAGLVAYNMRSGQFSIVPEPATVALLALAALSLPRGRRSRRYGPQRQPSSTMAR
ncbi:MAG: hypothetical protein ACOC95_10195 [Planctomycetota bacterium]